MKQRLYLDTSVFGGYFDQEFEDFTKPLFERIILGEFTILYSSITQQELMAAPAKVQNLVLDLKEEHTDWLSLSKEALELAVHYLSEGVVGKTSFVDCQHIAMATIYHADLLISWNFKHIVNIERIRGYNSVNIKFGYRNLEIRSPRDLMHYEND